MFKTKKFWLGFLFGIIVMIVFDVATNWDAFMAGLKGLPNPEHTEQVSH